MGETAERYRESNTRLAEDSALEIVVGILGEFKVEVPAPEELRVMAYSLALRTW